jgi:hypothetical protein
LTCDVTNVWISRKCGEGLVCYESDRKSQRKQKSAVE